MPCSLTVGQDTTRLGRDCTFDTYPLLNTFYYNFFVILSSLSPCRLHQQVLPDHGQVCEGHHGGRGRHRRTIHLLIAHSTNRALESLHHTDTHAPTLHPTSSKYAYTHTHTHTHTHTTHDTHIYTQSRSLAFI